MRPKIKKEELKELLKDKSITRQELASYYNVTPSAIDYQTKKIRDLDEKNEEAGITPGYTPKSEIKIRDQLQAINKKALSLLDGLTKNMKESTASDKDLAIKAMREIRAQHRLQIAILEKWVRIQAVEEWKREVLDSIGQEPEEVRNRIVNRIKNKASIKAALQAPRI